MRNELEQIKKIEEYLTGSLPVNERAAFEAELAGNAGLREDLALQQELMHGIHRAMLQQRIHGARRHFMRTRYLKKWGGLGSGFAIVVVAVIIITGRQHGRSANMEIPVARTVQTNDTAATAPARGKLDSALPGRAPVTGAAGGTLVAGGEDVVPAGPENRLPAQTFSLMSTTDTVITTQGGMVFAIPAGSFLDEHGRPVTGPIELVIREALDAASILRAGLSTTSGDRWLETGGMFHLAAVQNGKPLRVNPAGGLLARIPADSIRNDMLLFTGKRLPDGSIDWVDPKPMEHYLLPVDIHSLDFYPPQYLDSLDHWGYAAGNKVFTDSLYYSLSRWFEEGYGELPIGYSIREGATMDTIRRSLKVPPALSCGVNPAKIKTIWSDSFQNTIIATKEFERRMPFIHQSADGQVLDLYLEHLNLNISAIDEMAATQVSGDLRQRFLSFSALHEGRIVIGNKRVDLLRAYYQNQTRVYMAAIARAQKEFWQQQAQLDLAAKQRQYEESQRGGYTMTITRTGWCNADRYTSGLSTNTASDQSILVRIASESQYDVVNCYLLPDDRKSFIRLGRSGADYIGRLWPMTSYTFVVLGYKGDETFFYMQRAIQPGQFPQITPVLTDKTTLDAALSRLGTRSQVTDLKKEHAYFLFRQQDAKRVQDNRLRRQLTDKVMKLLYPCYQPKRDTIFMDKATLGRY